LNVAKHIRNDTPRFVLGESVSPAFVAVRVAVAAYLLYRGVQELRIAAGRETSDDVGSRYHPTFWTMLLLGLIFCALTLGWLVAYTAAVGKTRDMLARPRTRRAIEGITGCVLIGLGIRVATEHR
jgi:threonine/homoserine/homoserine lactone efflux protein